MARRWSRLPARRIDAKRADARTATERYVLYFLLPAWLIPGVLDWMCHRRTRIETTSGTRESLIHALMMSEVGVPVVLGLLFEIDPPVLALMLGHAVAHEATAFWDVSTAIRGGREVRPTEQHIHSFLEVLPFMAASSMVCLHWRSFRAMLGLEKGNWAIRLKRPRLGTSYLVAIGAAIAACLAAPYGEELLRCIREDRRRRAERPQLAPAPSDVEVIEALESVVQPVV